jgi:hypothetical protein
MRIHSQNHDCRVRRFAGRAAMRFAPLACAWTLAMLGAISGCGKDSTTGPPFAVEDTSKVALTIDQSGLTAASLFPLGEVPLGGVGGSNDPVAFRRSLNQTDIEREYAFADTVAGVPQSVIAMVCKYQKGTFQVVRQYAPQDPTPADSSDRLLDKVLHADWFRNVLLHRDGTSPTGWRVVNASEAYLLVDDHRACFDCHGEILQAQIQLPGGPMTLPITPLVAVDSLVHVSGSGPWTVTAVARRDDNIVILHDSQGSRRLLRTAPATFTGTVELGSPGLRHFTIEAFSDSSLIDDVTPLTQGGYTFLFAVDP